MRLLLTLVVCLISPFLIYGQKGNIGFESPQENLLNISEHSYFFEGGIGFQQNVLDEEYNQLCYYNFSSGVQLNPKFKMGVRIGWAMDRQPNFSDYLEGIEYLEGDIGLYTVTTIFQFKNSSINLPVSFGAGGAFHDIKIDLKSKAFSGNVDPNYYVYFEPGLNYELNLSENIQFGLGVSYRYFQNIQSLQNERTLYLQKYNASNLRSQLILRYNF